LQKDEAAISEWIAGLPKIELRHVHMEKWFYLIIQLCRKLKYNWLMNGYRRIYPLNLY